MEYTEKQIRNAKALYYEMLEYRSRKDYDEERFGTRYAKLQAKNHNEIVREIREGDKAVRRKWKLFFLEDERKKDEKQARSKEKIKRNKEASAEILAPIRSLRKLGEFGKWLNTSSNKYRRQHFSKEYTKAAVDAFLETL